jgi:hypothetical protein
MEPGTWAQWAGATATFMAVLVALFKDSFYNWHRRPRLQVRISVQPPDCHKIQIRATVMKTAPTLIVADSYYCRIWIENNGKSKANQVQVSASGLYRQLGDGTFKREPNFLPMNLLWSHTNEVFSTPFIPRWAGIAIWAM